LSPPLSHPHPANSPPIIFSDFEKREWVSGEFSSFVCEDSPLRAGCGHVGGTGGPKVLSYGVSCFAISCCPPLLGPFWQPFNSGVVLPRRSVIGEVWGRFLMISLCFLFLFVGKNYFPRNMVYEKSIFFRSHLWLGLRGVQTLSGLLPRHHMMISSNICVPPPLRESLKELRYS